ncbi:MAG: hypothetical protein ACC631_08630, partial [Halocynthiibacter sp.]
AGQASAGFFTSPRFLVGKSKAAITQCAGGDRIATKNNSWTYQSVGTKFYKHIWKNRPPRLSIPRGGLGFGFGSPTDFSSPILNRNKCNVTFRFRKGVVTDVNFKANVRGTQREFTCGIVTDRCLR